MRMFVIAVSVMAALSTASAQTAAPTPSAAPPPSAQPSPTDAKSRSGARGPNATRDACRKESDTKSLTGPERRDDMRSCMKTHREACLQAAKDAHVGARNGERRAYVKTCMEKGA